MCSVLSPGYAEATLLSYPPSIISAKRLIESLQINENTFFHISKIQQTGETIEISLFNNVNIDIIPDGTRWLVQVFPDDPLNPKLPIEQSIRLGSMLHTSLVDQGFQAKTGSVPLLEKLLTRREIILLIANLGALEYAA